MPKVYFQRKNNLKFIFREAKTGEILETILSLQSIVVRNVGEKHQILGLFLKREFRIFHKKTHPWGIMKHGTNSWFCDESLPGYFRTNRTKRFYDSIKKNGTQHILKLRRRCLAETTGWRGEKHEKVSRWIPSHRPLTSSLGENESIQHQLQKIPPGVGARWFIQKGYMASVVGFSCNLSRLNKHWQRTGWKLHRRLTP